MYVCEQQSVLCMYSLHFSFINMKLAQLGPNALRGIAPWHGSNWNEQQLGLPYRGPPNAIRGDLRAWLCTCVWFIWHSHTHSPTVLHQTLSSIQQQQGHLFNNTVHTQHVHVLVLHGWICKNIKRKEQNRPRASSTSGNTLPIIYHLL